VLSTRPVRQQAKQQTPKPNRDFNLMMDTFSSPTGGGPIFINDPNK